MSGLPRHLGHPLAELLDGDGADAYPEDALDAIRRRDERLDLQPAPFEEIFEAGRFERLRDGGGDGRLSEDGLELVEHEHARHVGSGKMDPPLREGRRVALHEMPVADWAI